MYKSSKRSEIIIHWIITLGILVLGNVVGGGLIVYVAGELMFAAFGFQIQDLNAAAHVMGYGMVILVLIHFATGGWWFAKCVEFVEEMEEQHQHAMAKFNR